MAAGGLVIINWMIILISSVFIFFGVLQLLVVKKNKKFSFSIRMISFGLFGYIFSALITLAFFSIDLDAANPFWYLPSIMFMISCGYFFLGAKKIAELLE